MVVVVDGDQMISFDDESTWAIKEAYAEMMCLRGTMLWSVDMLKPISALHDSTSVDTHSGRLLSEQNFMSEGCDLCDDRNVVATFSVEYNGKTMSCVDILGMLRSEFVPRHSEQCLSIVSSFRSLCCMTDSPKCDICGADTDLIEDKIISYSGNAVTCGDLQDSFHHLTKMFSFRCSLARESLKYTCCSEPCRICPLGLDTNSHSMVEVGGKSMTCDQFEKMLKTSEIASGSDKCEDSISPHADVCCSHSSNNGAHSLLASTTPQSPCNICMRDNSRYELKLGAVVEYRGVSVSCLDLNSVLAQSEVYQSDICRSAQIALFDGCCYEQCSLCRDLSIKWDATVQYNNQILSCGELGSMFKLGSVREGSEQCDAMQSVYSSSCCFLPPKEKCNLCVSGSEVNTHGFVKMRSSSMHCVDLVNGLAEREEEGSDTCEKSKLAFNMTCCQGLFASKSNTDSTYYSWLRSENAQPSSSGSALLTQAYIMFYLVTQFIFSLARKYVF